MPALATLPADRPYLDPVVQLRLAREVAADMRDLPEILRVHDVTKVEFSDLMASHPFQRMLNQCAVEWQSVGNTAERVRLKAMAFIEEAMPEFYARAHDPKEALPAKVEILKAVTRLAGISERGDQAIGSERMVVTINLGADHKLVLTKDITPKTIDQGDEEE